MQESKPQSINERYDETLEMFNLIQDRQQNEGLTPKNIDRYKMVVTDLGYILLFGKIEACSGLAYIFKEGLTGNKNDYSYKLFLLIGSKLGNATCTKQLANLQNINEVEKEATIWTNVIKNHTKNHDIKTTSTEMFNARTTLETSLKYDSIDLKLLENCFGVTRLKSDYSPDSYKMPVYSNSLPQEKKDEVKHTGVVKEKDGCEIC